MEELLRQAAGVVSLSLEALALLVIAFGAAEGAVGVVRVMLPPRRSSNTEKRAVWLEFSRWLVAGLTFQLAADIVQTMVVPGWADVGRVAAVAIIRAFLTFTIERDIDSMRERDALRRKEPLADRP
jgi:uncharacterized membrane protein